MNSDIRETVKEHYGKSAEASNDGCCTSSSDQSVNEYAKTIGYSETDVSAVPEGANLGLGCGNPLGLDLIKHGDTVLDLGSGAGFDCFLAAQRVSSHGHVIGIDMTPEMIAKANENKEKVAFENVEFRLGYIEDLPVEANSIDVVISNCVINLSPEKGRVFHEAFRVLKPGGCLAVSDIVLLRKLPRFVRKSVDAYVGCVAGAALKEDYLKFIGDAGFQEISVEKERLASDLFPDSDPTIQKMLRYIPLPNGMIKKLSGRYAASIQVIARKPK